MNKQGILWFDAVGGLSVGGLVLLFSPWLHGLYGLPSVFVVFLGVANVAYGCFSASLVRMPVRSRRLLYTLAGANCLWALLCCVYVYWFWETVTFYGAAHLLLEAVYVGTLGVLEWRWNERLVTRQYAPIASG